MLTQRTDDTNYIKQLEQNSMKKKTLSKECYRYTYTYKNITIAKNYNCNKNNEDNDGDDENVE